jgi:2,4-didehydro-3-deoxy-L-rhamnonate hydrolase
MTLLSGDVISTGTPAGVGLGLDPPRFLKAGDVMELSIEGLGTQKQAVHSLD